MSELKALFDRAKADIDAGRFEPAMTKIRECGRIVDTLPVNGDESRVTWNTRLMKICATIEDRCRLVRTA